MSYTRCGAFLFDKVCQITIIIQVLNFLLFLPGEMGFPGCSRKVEAHRYVDMFQYETGCFESEGSLYSSLSRHPIINIINKLCSLLCTDPTRGLFYFQKSAILKMLYFYRTLERVPLPPPLPEASLSVRPAFRLHCEGFFY